MLCRLAGELKTALWGGGGFNEAVARWWTVRYGVPGGSWSLEFSNSIPESRLSLFPPVLLPLCYRLPQCYSKNHHTAPQQQRGAR